MLKQLKKLLFLLPLMVLTLVFAGRVLAAAGDVSVDIETPKTPTRHNSLTINFVTLDIQGRAITVKCYKKGPSDGGFTQFGADLAISAGGNTDNCDVTGSLMNQTGTYQFYVIARAGGDTATSQTVSVDYNTDGPSTPTDYSKSLANSCQYKIHFKTADDGQTTKVEIYRSESTTFTADGGTRVATITIGPNTEHDAYLDKPDCNKDYYFVIRAFDSAGNGSGLVGDSLVTVTAAGTTEAGTSTPALVVFRAAQGTGLEEGGAEAGQLPTEGETVTGETQGTILGTEAVKYPWWVWLGFILLLLAIAAYVFKKVKAARA